MYASGFIIYFCTKTYSKTYKQKLLEQFTKGTMSTDVSASEGLKEAYKLPYDRSKFEVPLERITIDGIHDNATIKPG